MSPSMDFGILCLIANVLRGTQCIEVDSLQASSAYDHWNDALFQYDASGSNPEPILERYEHDR